MFLPRSKIPTIKRREPGVRRVLSNTPPRRPIALPVQFGRAPREALASPPGGGSRKINDFYISRDQPRAHELTYHMGQPSPAPGRLSPYAPAKRAAMPCGTVPVSPTGTTGSFPIMLSTGTTYSTGVFGSISYRIRDPADCNHPGNCTK